MLPDWRFLLDRGVNYRITAVKDPDNLATKAVSA